MPTSDHDVLDLMNRAAMDAPSMSLAPQSVLASAQNRRRKQRQTRGSMALAAFAAAGAIWLGSGSGLGDLLTDQVDPAGPTPSPTEWDDSVSFEAPVPDGGGAYAGFKGSSLVREPGEGFTVEFDDGSQPLSSIEIDLPLGVDAFSIGGDTLLVSEPRFDATPVLGYSADAYRNGSPGVPLTDGDQQVFVWFLEEYATAGGVQDVYWLLPDQVATSTGATVIDEVVTEGDDEVTVVILPETEQWGMRTSSGLQDLLAVVPPGDDVVIDPPSDGDVWVSVIPGWAENPVFSPPGSFDAKPMSTREVGEYLIAWARSSERDDDGRPALVQWDRPADMALTETSTVTVVAQGDGVKVAVEGTDSEMTVASGDTGARAAEAADGSALVIAAFPEGISSIDGPPGPATAAPQTVFRMYSDVVAMQEEAGTRPGMAVLPNPDGRVAVGLPAVPELVESDPVMKILPTLLFQGEAGPQWAGGGRPATVDVAGTEIRVSAESDLEIWAASCGASDATTGGIGSPILGSLECTDPDGSAEPNIIVALVLPTDVAATARLVTMPDRGSAAEDVPDPIVTDIGDGLSLWAVPLGPVRTGILSNFRGMDLDGDGVVDEPPPFTD